MPGCTKGCSNSVPNLERTMTEGGRIANILSNSRNCMAAEALAKARAFSSGKACGALCTVTRDAAPVAPLPSMLLNSQINNCYNKYQSLEGCVPESIRIARLDKKTIDKSTDPTNPETRFSDYVRFFPAPCPPIPEFYKTAGEPKKQLKNCPLPNKPENPVLPG
jgi:hypothetical protein